MRRKNAMDTKICANYVLMNTWLEPFIKSISDLGLNVIGMVKPLKQSYIFHDKAYMLGRLQKIAVL